MGNVNIKEILPDHVGYITSIKNKTEVIFLTIANDCTKVKKCDKMGINIDIKGLITIEELNGLIVELLRYSKVVRFGECSVFLTDEGNVASISDGYHVIHSGTYTVGQLTSSYDLMVKKYYCKKFNLTEITNGNVR